MGVGALLWFKRIASRFKYLSFHVNTFLGFQVADSCVHGSIFHGFNFIDFWGFNYIAFLGFRCTGCLALRFISILVSRHFRLLVLFVEKGLNPE